MLRIENPRIPDLEKRIDQIARNASTVLDGIELDLNRETIVDLHARASDLFGSDDVLTSRNKVESDDVLTNINQVLFKSATNLRDKAVNIWKRLKALNDEKLNPLLDYAKELFKLALRLGAVKDEEMDSIFSNAVV